MSRANRADRSATKGRPKRRAAKTHFFKYQLASNPSRAEENDLKRALQESLEDQISPKNSHRSKGTNCNTNNNNNNNNSSARQSVASAKNNSILISANSSDVSTRANNSSSSNKSDTPNTSASSKRTRSSYLSTPFPTIPHILPPANKRAKLNPYTNGHKTKHDTNTSLSSLDSPEATLSHVNKAIRTYSRSQFSEYEARNQNNSTNGLKSSTPLTNNKTQDHQLKLRHNGLQQTTTTTTTTTSTTTPTKANAPPNAIATVDHSPQTVSKSTQTANIKIKMTAKPTSAPTQKSPDTTQDLSKKKDHNVTTVKVASNKRRLPQGSWSLLGSPEEKIVYLRDDEPPRRLICYPAIKHVEGDVIQVKDSVLLRSGAKKTDPPYIAKVCAFWEDAETGNVMMSLLWYYKPEHTEDGRKPHHLSDEIFASRHRDVDSVECIEDKCYVLTFNEYCRYRKRCKMEQVMTNWSLTDVTIPVSNESYPRRNRIPDSSVNPELVFCCRQIYDSRTRRLIKNPLINPKYGHI